MSDKLIEIVKEMYAALPRQDWQTFEAHLHPDFRVVEADSLPFAGEFCGMAGFQQLVTRVFELFSVFEPNTTAFCAGDGHVMVRVEMKLTGRSSGRTVNTEMIEVFRFEGDKLLEIRPFYFNSEAVASILD